MSTVLRYWAKWRLDAATHRQKTRLHERSPVGHSLRSGCLALQFQTCQEGRFTQCCDYDVPSTGVFVFVVEEQSLDVPCLPKSAFLGSSRGVRVLRSLCIYRSQVRCCFCSYQHCFMCYYCFSLLMIIMIIIFNHHLIVFSIRLQLLRHNGEQQQWCSNNMYSFFFFCLPLLCVVIFFYFFALFLLYHYYYYIIIYKYALSNFECIRFVVLALQRLVHLPPSRIRSRRVTCLSATGAFDR